MGPIATNPTTRGAPTQSVAPSIRAVLTWAIVLPSLAASALLLMLSTLTMQRIAEDLATSATDATVRSVRAEVRSYLQQAVRCSDTFTRRVNAGDLTTSDLRDWFASMHAELLATPQVASICFGASTGESVWLLRGREGRLEFGVGTSEHANPPMQAQEFFVSADAPLLESFRSYRYDPRQRPWYAAALRANTHRVASTPTMDESPSFDAMAGIGTWTQIYNWFEGQNAEALIGTGFARPLYFAGDTSAVKGVLVIDVTLGGLSAFLKSQPMVRQATDDRSGTPSGRIAVVQSDGTMIASSHGTVTQHDGKPLHLAASGDAFLAAAGQAMRTGQSRVKATDAGTTTLVPARVASERLTLDASSGQGLDWRIVVVVPEVTFLAEPRAAQRRGLALAGAVVAGAAGLGLLLARRLARPMMAIAQRLRALGEGDFDSRLGLEGARELTQVSTALNDVAQGLRQRMELERALGVAREVQLALLPKDQKEFFGLDIAGRARYCDQTGGDYFDYLDISRASPTATCVALGDVMGHGVGAALLMATARAALRARVEDAPHLGELLTRANTLLVQSTGAMQFVTMVLVVLDPATGKVRLASAGHDAPLVFDPVAAEFVELEGGGVPLGVEEGVAYTEYGFDSVVKPGRVLVIGTDGIWETANDRNEMFGKDRLRDIIRANADKSANDIADVLDASLDRFKGQAPQKDDITYIIVKVR